MKLLLVHDLVDLPHADLLHHAEVDGGDADLVLDDPQGTLKPVK